MAARAGRSGRAPTIRDVAERAGVATSTVSRALSDPDRVHPATRARVHEAAGAINYVPSAHARSLATGKTGSVALLIPDVTNPFYFGIIRGTQRQLNAAGYQQVLVDTEESALVEANALTRLRKTVDGVVLAAPRLSDREINATAAIIAVVTINRSVRGVPAVVLDTPSGVEQVMHHLASLGHRHIGYVSGPKTSWSNTRRWSAIQAAAEQLGLDVVIIGPFAPTLASGAAAADAALNCGVSACVAFNDLLAIGLLSRFAQRGVSVPDDISVVGCDDIFGSDFCHPPLTTVSGSQEQAGRSAITRLLSRLSGGVVDDSTTLLPTHLQIRSSTGPAPTDPASTTGRGRR